MKKSDLPNILYDIIRSLGGRADMMTVFEEFWRRYGATLTPPDPLFYTWNYDIRWAATELRKSGKMKSTHLCEKGIWETI